MSEDNQLVKCGCQQQGLALFPVRYTVIPNYIKKNLPAWANLPGVTDVKLNDEYQYHIRRLRAGFIYLYLPSAGNTESTDPNLSEEAKIAQENQYWLIYSIDETGQYVRQTNIQSVQAVDSQDDVFKCPNLKQDPTLCSFISIPNPERYDKIYIAYSEFPWTVEAMQSYRKSPLPRMQEIDIKTWQTQKQQQSATVATTQTLKQILDLDADFIINNLPTSSTSFVYNEQDNLQIKPDSDKATRPQFKFGKPILEKTITFNSAREYDEAKKDEKYRFYTLKLNENSIYRDPYIENDPENDSVRFPKKITYKLHDENISYNTTPFPWNAFNIKTSEVTQRADKNSVLENDLNMHIQTLHKNMQKYSGDNGAPMILALEDALGVGEELNNYYNDLHGYMLQFEFEAEMELDVKRSLVRVRDFVKFEQFKHDQLDRKDAPFNDELYRARQRGKDLDDVIYQQEYVDDQYTKRYGQFGDGYLSQIPYKTKVDSLNIDLNTIYSPTKNEMRGLVKSYILLAKNHFYGQPFGKIYYQRFINYLKTGQDSGSLAYYEDTFEPYYLPGTIYYKVEKYDHSQTQDPITSQRDIQDALAQMHKKYTELVDEHEAKKPEFNQIIEAKTESCMQKDYLTRLDKVFLNEFNQLEDNFRQQISDLLEIRAKLLIDWLQNSHYLLTINDLSFANKLKLTTLNDRIWIEKFRDRWQQELKEALDNKEITPDEAEELQVVDLNGIHLNAIFQRAVRGLELSHTGEAFLRDLADLDQLQDIQLEISTETKLKFGWLGLRAISHNISSVLQVLNNMNTLLKESGTKKYVEDDLNEIKIAGLHALIMHTRKATLMLEYFRELEILKQSVSSKIRINTTFGPKFVLLRGLFDFSSPGTSTTFKLLCYDQFVKKTNLVADTAIKMGLVLGEACMHALSGVLWQTAILFVKAKYQLLQMMVSSAEYFATVDSSLLHMASKAYSAKLEHLKAQLRRSLNVATENLENRFTAELSVIGESLERQLGRRFLIIPDTNLAGGVSLKQLAGRSVALAALVGAFEIYSWQHIMQKQPNLFHDESDVALEKMAASVALASATADFIATSVKFCTGKEGTVFAYAKTAFGVLGGISSVYSCVKMAKGAANSWTVGNYAAAVTGLISSAFYGLSGLSMVMLGLSYRYSWVYIFYRKRLINQLRRFGLTLLTRISQMAMRILLYRLAGTLGLIAILIELLYDWLSDNEIQTWLSLTVLGKRRDELKYTTPLNQRLAFQSIELLNAIYDNLSEKLTEQIEQKEAQQTQPYPPKFSHEEVMLAVEDTITQRLPATISAP